MTHTVFKIAQVSTAHGVRGEVKLSCFLDDAGDIARYLPLSIKSGAPFSFKITGHLKGQLIVKPDGIDDRNAADALRGTELFADAAKRPEINANEFYYDQLIGLPARLADGTKIGTVTAVDNYGAGDIIQIKTATEELLLPLQAPYVNDISDDAVIITLPEYLGDDHEP